MVGPRIASRQPEGPPPPPVVQRMRLRYAKRGRLRFISHRDFARAFERALRRAEIPIALLGRLHPAPQDQLRRRRADRRRAARPSTSRSAWPARSTPSGCAPPWTPRCPTGWTWSRPSSPGPGRSPTGCEASAWRIELPGVPPEAVQAAVAGFLGHEEVGVERRTKSGPRVVDVRAPVLRMDVSGAAPTAPDAPRAIIDLVVRQVTPAVRPDDVVAALRSVAGLAPAAPPVAVRLAQGPLEEGQWGRQTHWPLIVHTQTTAP